MAIAISLNNYKHNYKQIDKLCMNSYVIKIVAIAIGMYASIIYGKGIKNSWE